MKHVFFIMTIILTPAFIRAQVPRWVEDFNDNTLTGWEVIEEHQRTFNLSEEDSVLKIMYTRTAVSWEWDNFNYTPPFPILIYNDPHIVVKIKSNINTQLTFKPIYSNGTDDWLQRNVSGDNAWHEVRFILSLQSGVTLDRIFMYLDGGSTQAKSGTVYFDDLNIVGDTDPTLQIIAMEAEAVDSTQIDLSWSVNYPTLVDYYKIYRSNDSGFTLDALTLLDTTSQMVYADIGLPVDKTFFYKVVVVDSSGVESNPSNEVNAYTGRPGAFPNISVQSANNNIGLYEKFEAILRLQNVSFQNPYDPDEIDVGVIFTSPSNRTWTIFGFYDNFDNDNQWKVRFSPNEIGAWQYTLSVTALNGTDTSAVYTFEAEDSEHHGWLRVATDKSHYLMHDDGTSFYGVGVAYPWQVHNGSGGLADLEASGANLYYYWNIRYDIGGGIIESLNSGLGRYDQDKCGRIDQILGWSESRGLKMILSIWPHDLLCDAIPGWAQEWDNNPYNQICEAAEFYGSDEAWAYQEKQYRYLIARWGYSRSLGVWESVCEMDGTDGWVYGDQVDALDWIEKVHDFFQLKDPYDHPTSASKKGGVYWSDAYEIVDLPDFHLYETQSGAPHYPDDLMRSSLWIYGSIAQRFWQDFQKPGIFGEAGYYDNYGNYDAGSQNYIQMYHNALWVSWANGLSATPLWWDFATKSIFTADLMDQISAFSRVAQRIDYAHISLEPADMVVTDCDAYAMVGDTLAFGWIRDIEGVDVSNQLFTLNGFDEDGYYSIAWIDPWTSDTLRIDHRLNQDSLLVDVIPEFSGKRDIAFIAQPSERGDNPQRLELMAYPMVLYSDTSFVSEVNCFVLDAQDRICPDASNTITFTLEGPGSLMGDNPATPSNGKATIDLRAQRESGIAEIIASSSGLMPDTVMIFIEKFLFIDDFEAYASDEVLTDVWHTQNFTDVVLFLESSVVGGGLQAMRLDYGIGNGNLPYAGVTRSIQGNFEKAGALSFWIKGDGSNRALRVRLFIDGSHYWSYDYPLESADSMTVDIPLDVFQANYDALEINPVQFIFIAFTIYQGDGDLGNGTIYFDNMQFKPGSSTGIRNMTDGQVPDAYTLYPNYPNPFNHETIIQYALPMESVVNITVYNTYGQVVDVLVNQKQSAGIHQVRWNARDLAAGLYFYRLKTETSALVQKCILLK